MTSPVPPRTAKIARIILALAAAALFTVWTMRIGADANTTRRVPDRVPNLAAASG